jgi:hypothetical protein
MSTNIPPHWSSHISTTRQPYDAAIVTTFIDTDFPTDVIANYAADKSAIQSPVVATGGTSNQSTQ